MQERCVLLDGFSKTYAMTGWRLGYALWPAALLPLAERLAVNSHSCVNAAAQFAGIAALEGPREPCRHMVEAFAHRRERIVAALNRLAGVRCLAPGGAFYVFPNITGTGLDSRTLQTRLLDETGVATISGTSFGAEGEGFLRLSYAASMDQIETAVARIDEMIKKSTTL